MATSNCTTKRCTHCLKIYPATKEYFKPDKQNAQGLHSWCRQCHRQAARTRYQEKRDELLAKMSARYWENPEPIRAYHREFAKRPDIRARLRITNRKWREANPDKVREYTRRSRQKNKVKRREYMRDWRLNNPERALELSRRYPKPLLNRRVNEANRRARKNANQETHTCKDVETQLKSQKYRCWWCGCDIHDSYHVDHLIPLARGGSNNVRNIVISCPKCNMSKGAKMPHEWIGRLL